MRTTFLTLTTFCFLILIASTATAEWASLSGQFVYGPPGTQPPKQFKVTPNKDVEVCGKQPLFDESLSVDPETRGLSNVVVWAYRPSAIHPVYEEATASKVTVANVACRFEPHVVALWTKQTLEITNPDPVTHNAMMNFLKNQPQNLLIPAMGKVEVRPKKAEIIPVSISCTIHPWMQAKIMVQDHPYIAVTDTTGKFRLENLPAGKLTLKVWHEKVGYLRDVKIDNEPAKWNKGKYQLTLTPGNNEQHVYQVAPSLFAKK